MKLPSFQFYPGDWRKDPNLSRCSKAAKGVWMDMLCLMFECETRGVLSTGGRPWSDEDIAVAVGGDILEVKSCIQELIDKGVASRNSSGCVYSRRLIRDEEQRRHNAKRQDKYRKSNSNANSNALVTPMSHASSSSSSSSASTSRLLKACAPPATPFDVFYSLYPKKKARKDAEKAWKTAFKEAVLTEDIWETVAKPALLRQCTSFDWQKDGGTFVPLPATWIRGKRWEDEVTMSPQQSKEAEIEQEIQRRRELRQYADSLIAGATRAHN